MAVVFKKTEMLTDTPLHYCPGCTHGIAHRLVAEAIEELGLKGRVVGIAPVGCAVFAYKYFNCDMQEAAHGRAPAVATGIKLTNPDNIVFAYQGDGDLASIGMAEIVHAAARGMNITVIFINNAIYGMTGGQMAPTTLLGQKATDSGRPQLYRPLLPRRRAQHQKGEEGDPAGVQKSDGRQRLLLRGAAFHLPHQLAYVPRQGA